MTHPRSGAYSFVSFGRKLMDHQGLVASMAGGFLMIALVFGSLTIMHTNVSILLNAVQLVAFAGLGWFHLSYIQGISFLSKDYFLEHLVYTLMVGIAMCIVLSIIYYLTDSEVLMGLASSCAFVLPFMLVQAWFYYKHLPKDQKLAWTSSETEPAEISRYYNNKLAIRFKLSRQYFDLKEHLFPVTVSTWVSLGIIFNQFVMKYNEISQFPIELVDAEDYKYGWEFYAESFFGLYSRQLSPEFDVRKNKLLRNDTVVARRIRLFDEGAKVVRHLLPA